MMMGELLAVSYNNLWKQLIDKIMSTVDLRKKANIALNTLTCMRKDQDVIL